MITERLFRFFKSDSLRESWIIKSRIMQQIIIAGISLYNAAASRTGLFKKNIGKSCGEGIQIGKHSVIAPDSLVIGIKCRIHDYAVLEPGTRIGNNVVIGPGTIVGSEGFEIRRIGDQLIPIVHTGGVVISDDVLIGSHVCIDKSLNGDCTEISEKTQVEDNVHIAHGVKIGKNCAIASSVMIGGKVTIGNAVRIGPAAKIADQLTIGDGAILSAGAVVTKNVAPGQKVTGNFAINHERFLRHIQNINKEE